MIQEELVTLETADLLKEKGFNERKYLIDVSTLNHCYKYLSVPPQSVAQKWLRETKNIHICVYYTPREAFADLIDKVLGKGIWLNNPYVFCYSFKLID